MSKVRQAAQLARNVSIPANGVSLDGTLTIPAGARGVVLFAHGSGSSRHSPRNRDVASLLHTAGIGTLLFDLLARDEDSGYEKRFDIALLTRRLLLATAWLEALPEAAALRVGYFGASTGAAAALAAAAQRRGQIAAVVSRGGRPDLAGTLALAKVTAPTLLIVGGDDPPVIALNRAAEAQMSCERSLVIVPGATHLFEEPGMLEEVARLAAMWFARWFAPVERASPG